MPRIRDYSAPQINQSGVEDVVSTAQFAGAGAAATNKIIGAATDLYSTIEQRDAQDEISNLNSKFADARAEWTLKIDEDTKNQTIDPKKNAEAFSEYVNKLGDGISTAAGRRFYESQAARLGGYVTKATGRGYAQVAGEKAEQAWINASNKSSAAVHMDPTSFSDSLDSLNETLQEQIAHGVFPPAAAQKFKTKMETDLAKSAIRGYADLNPALGQKKLDSGEFDAYLSADDRAQMQGYVNQQNTAKEVEERRLLANQEKAKKAAGEQWAQGALPKLSDGSLNTKDILNSPMNSDDKIRWMKLADEATKKQGETDPRIYNELVRRTTLPDSDPRKIRNISDLADYAGKGVSIDDITKINGFIKKLPESQNITDNRKRLFDFAESKLNKKDPLFGVSDPDGEYNMAQFSVALQNAEAQMRLQKKDVGLLYDPTSKEYFGNNISKYQLTPQQILKKQAGRFTDEAYAKPKEDAALNNTEVPTPGVGVQPKPAQGEKVRRQGESAKDYLKRIKGGG